MKKHILIFCSLILSFTAMGQVSTKMRYDVFSIDAYNLNRMLIDRTGALFQFSYERQYSDFASLFFSQHGAISFSEKGVFSQTVFMQRNYLEENIKSLYIGPYVNFSIVPQKRALNVLETNELYSVIGGGIGFGWAFDIRKLHFDLGFGLGIGHSFTENYYTSLPVFNRSIKGFGIATGGNGRSANLRLLMMPSFVNFNIGFKRKRKIRMKNL